MAALSMIDKISVVIITKDAERTLRQTLLTLKSFREIIVFDNDSSDSTKEIAAEFTNVILHTGVFIGFGKTKNMAISLASQDWILSLDADESICDSLVDELSKWFPKDPASVGVLLRDNIFMGTLVNKGGWGHDRIVRLFNRKRHQFSDNSVHESVVLNANSKKISLKSSIKHDAVQNIGQFLIKVDRYTEIRRFESSKTYHPIFIVLKSAFAFFRSYFFQAGFTTGWRGLVIAWNESNGTFYKYMKRYIDKQVK